MSLSSLKRITTQLAEEPREKLLEIIAQTSQRLDLLESDAQSLQSKLHDAEEARDAAVKAEGVYMDAVRSLESRLFSCELDAARYRWMKANHLQTGPDSWIRTGDDLEEAIDAVMETPK